LPTTDAGWSHLYAEKCIIEQDQNAVTLRDKRGVVQVPCAMLSVLMIGPGVSITSAAIRTLADHGCSVVWVGEEGVRFYASGLGETHSSRRMLHQARCYSNAVTRQAVAVRLYRMRFSEDVPEDTTIAQLRGKEGARVRSAYAEAAKEWGVPWQGRDYNRRDWNSADPINRALSAANACVYGVCHAAIVAAGYLPGIGFIHTGDRLSFVFDVADLYKTEAAVPAAFAAVAEGVHDLDSRTRRFCREAFHVSRVLGRIVNDIGAALRVPEAEGDDEGEEDGFALPSLWDPEGPVQGGRNHA
jgi:CRISPR-associated protein Cas1